MKAFGVLFTAFLSRTFRSPLSYLIHFGVPVAAFLGMYSLLRMNGTAAFAGAQAVGLVTYFTMIQAVMVVGLVLRDKEQGITGRILASPATRLEYVLGNGAAAYLVLCAQGAALAAFIGLAFGGETGLGFGRMAPFLLAFNAMSVGFAFLVCSLSDSESGAMLTANFAVMLSALLGGAFFPVEFMNASLQKAAVAFPHYWAMKALAQAQAGAPWPDAAMPLLVLALYGCLFILAQLAIGKRRGAEAGTIV